MSADMCVAALALPSGQRLDWDLAEAVIRDLPEETVSALADDFGYDIDTDVRARLRDAVAATRNAVEGWNRECTSFRFGETTFWLTGGLSTGSSPTDLFDDFSILDSSGIAQAIGFSWPADTPDTHAADTTDEPEGGQ